MSPSFPGGTVSHCYTRLLTPHPRPALNGETRPQPADVPRDDGPPRGPAPEGAGGPPQGGGPPKRRTGPEVLAGLSEEQLTHARTWYGVRDDLFLARELGCDAEELRALAWELFDEPLRDGPWSDDETAALRKYLGAVELDLIGRMLGRSREAIDRHLVELTVALRADALSPDEIVTFKRLYGTRSDEDLSLVFGRTLAMVKQIASELCLSKDKVFLRRSSGGAQKTRMPRWSSEELKRLEEMYPAHSNLDIAQELGRSVKSVVSKAHNLGLKKDKARLQQMGRQNVRMRYER